jgi:hypothetical protein
VNLNVLGLKEKERNVTEAVEYPGHCVAKVSFVGEDAFEGSQQI